MIMMSRHTAAAVVGALLFAPPLAPAFIAVHTDLSS